MGDLWFTSDTHYGHANIVKYCNRPFGDVATMDSALIERFNARVKPGDEVYHLGDFAFARERGAVEAYRRRLNGNVHLIFGNHDHKVTRQAQGFAEMIQYKELTVGEQRVILSHYPLASWNKMHHGSWHLHGHSHGNLTKVPTLRRIDVGVDPMGYKPVHFDEVAVMMKDYGFAPVDHHGRQDE